MKQWYNSLYLNKEGLGIEDTAIRRWRIYVENELVASEKIKNAELHNIYFIFQQGNTTDGDDNDPVMTIRSSGRIGMGTTDPSTTFTCCRRCNNKIQQEFIIRFKY